MNQSKLIGLILLVGAAFLIYLGLNQANSPLGEINEAFTGSYSDETLGYMLGGAITGVLALYFLFKK
jgi:threonine/homoserine/homoserine lactone efflux protein